MSKKLDSRLKRKAHIRKRLVGSTARPRLTVFRSLKHIYAQVIDDSTGRTLAAACSTEDAILKASAELKKCDIAKKVGEALAKRCIEKQVTHVAFDRNGFIYHGRVAKVAEGAREGGLQF